MKLDQEIKQDLQRDIPLPSKCRSKNTGFLPENFRK